MPSPAEEATRELVRTHEDLKADRRITQQRIKSMLLCHGARPPVSTKGWRQGFERWVRGLELDQPAAQRALWHLLGAFDTRCVQLAAIEADIAGAANDEPLVQTVRPLRCLRGIDTLSAATIAAEVCDGRRFGRAEAFMGFTELVPAEHSSGARERRGSISARWGIDGANSEWSLETTPDGGGVCTDGE